MIRQYDAKRHRIQLTPRGPKRVGTIPIGTILKPDGWQPRVIVEAWIPREYSAFFGRGQFATRRMVGGHLAQVRCLQSGRRFLLSDAWMIDRDEV